VNVAGYPVAVEVDAESLARVYLPTLHVLQSQLAEQRRVVAGLAGIPGSGKSTFAATLARIADLLWGMGRLAAVAMDGWHWPNAVLDVRSTVDEAGNTIPLRQRKGGPESFDVESLAATIAQLKSADRPVLLPVYDRRVHDPVPGGVTVGPGTSVVLIEGNFLLSRRPPWNSVSELLHPRLFMEWDLADARARVIARHIRGGATPEQAARKYDVNDRLNTQAVLETADHADYRVTLPDKIIRQR
jgi:pantothenate kinase